MPGIWELMIILGIVVIIFGAGRLPGLGRDVGKMIKNFGDSMKGKDAIDVTPDKAKIEDKPSTNIDEKQENGEKSTNEA